MQTIKLEIEDSKLNIVLNIIQSLKEDLITKYEIVNQDKNENKNELNDQRETRAFSNHTASSIEEWRDTSEDAIWK